MISIFLFKCADPETQDHYILPTDRPEIILPTARPTKNLVACTLNW